jgi:DAK2 domain fusion protein YloV
VREPQEGTILTVVRALAERADEVAGLPLADALAETLAAGERALARTPEQLPVLADAGVVDAGGAALLELVRGVAAHVAGAPIPELDAVAAELPLEAVHREQSRFRYCTSFFVEGRDVDPGALEREIEPLGDSLLVVGSPGAVKVHVHTDAPGDVLALATRVGVLEEVDIKNMHVQAVEREERLAREVTVCGAVAVCAGDGNRKLFESLGATCVEGGQSMNPSTADLVGAAERLGAAEIVLLPNNKNVILAAEQAAEASSKPISVVPTRSLQAGLAAMVAFDASRPASENVPEMEEAAAGVLAGAVAQASRAATLDGIEISEGAYVGLVDEQAVASGPDLAVVARAVAERVLEDGPDVLTVLLGAETADVEPVLDAIRAQHPDVELECHVGGQPHYPLLFAAE